VDRGCGHDEQAEPGEQHEDRDRQPGGEPLLQRVAEQEADEAALAVGRHGSAHDVQDAERAEGERRPADGEPPRPPLGSGWRRTRQAPSSSSGGSSSAPLPSTRGQPLATA
jgi:hypothetical protein